MSKHHRPQPLPTIGPAPKKTLLERMREEWIAFSLLTGFIGVIVTGTTRVAGFWGTKADAASVSLHDSTVDTRLGSTEKRLDHLEMNAAVQSAVEQAHFAHLHDELRGVREDVRAANHLPPLPPEPPEKVP